MTEGDPRLLEPTGEVCGLAAAPAPMQDRATEVLQRLGLMLPFDAGWLAVRDRERHRHVPLATSGPAEPLLAYFGRPEADQEVEALGLNRRRPPLLASEIPIPLSAVCAWADHLLPAGFREGLAVGLFTSAGRHLGFLSLLSADPSRPSAADREVVAAVATVIADDLDRARDISETARIVARASAGVVLTRSGDVLALPGLPDDRLLAAGSLVVSTAADELAATGAYITFLAPTIGTSGARVVRVTALDCARPELDHLSAAVLLSPPGDLSGLTGLDLRVLGLLIEGVTDIADLARTFRVPEAAVSESLGRCLVALRATDLTTATVRALRSGLRIPPRLAAGP